MTYHIVVWLYDNIDYEDFKDEATLKRAALAKDEFGSIEGWMNSSGDWVHDIYDPKAKWEHGHTKQWTTLRQGIDEYNEKSITAEINAAKTKADLDKVKIKEIESRDIISSLETLKAEKAKEFQALEIKEATVIAREKANDLKTRIRNADDYDALSRLSKEINKEDFSREIVNELNDAWRQRDNVVTADVADAIKDRIRGASNADELREIRNEELPNLREDRQKELRPLIDDMINKLNEEQNNGQG